MWVGEKSTPEVRAAPVHVRAPEEGRRPLREWAKDLKDLPDDGIAFFR